MYAQGGHETAQEGVNNPQSLSLQPGDWPKQCEPNDEPKDEG
jgi:hypothetical protein